MKKIVVATSTSYYSKSGMGRFIQSILPHLLRKYDVRLFMSGSMNGTEISSPHPSLTLFKLPHYHIPTGNDVIRFDKSAKMHLEDADLYFIQDSWCLHPLRIALRNKKPVVRYFHAYDWDGLSYKFHTGFLKKPLAMAVKPLFLRFLKYFDCVIFPSSSMLDTLKEKLHTSTAVVPMGIDRDYFRPPENRSNAKKAVNMPAESIVMGYVGRFSLEKNLSMLIDVFSSLSKKYDNLYLLLVGSGNNKIVKKAKKVPRVKIIQSQSHILPYFHAMDIFCMPSLTETTSLATMEAMATGLPVVASSVGCIPEHIAHGIDGLLCRSGCKNDFMTNCDHLINNEQKRIDIGSRACETMISKSDWEKTADGLISIFEGLLANNKTKN